MLSTVRRVDGQGRIALPSDWRSKSLKDTQEVVLVEQDDFLVIRPRKKVDLTEFFDSVETYVDPKAFRDYAVLKRALLRKGRKE